MEISLELKPHATFEFEVEKIIDVSVDGRYRVQWKPAWVSRFHLVGCDLLIQQFLQKHHRNGDYQQHQVEGDVEYQEHHDKVVDEHHHHLAEKDIACDHDHVVENHSTEIEIKLEPDIQQAVSDDGSGMLRQDDTERNHDLTQNVSSTQNLSSSSAFSVEMKEEGTTLEIKSADHRLSSFMMDVSTLMVENHDETQSSGTAQREVSATNSIDNISNPQSGYICTLCNKKFSQQSSLERHQRIHNDEQPFSCLYCERRFSRKDHLTLHMRIHTGEKPYQCPYCEYSCARKSHLTVHTRTHMQKKPYHCHICGKGFNQKGGLNSHLLLHVAVKSLQCDRCSQTFGTESTFNQHAQYCLSSI